MTTNDKTIILMRHADTLPATDNIDYNRKLSPKGIKQAEDTVSFLAKFEVDKVLVSPTMRTQQTLNIIQQNVSIANTEIVEEIYKENADRILEIILSQPGSITNLMIIGHNPTICSLAFDLAKSVNENYEYLMNSLMPPATIVVINMPNIVSWSELAGKHLGDITSIFKPI